MEFVPEMRPSTYIYCFTGESEWHLEMWLRNKSRIIRQKKMFAAWLMDVDLLAFVMFALDRPTC